MTHDLILPSKPRIFNEHGTSGTYEIDGLYPGYGHTLGNSLRRIILSSLPGAAVTKVKIKNVEHEFSAIDGIKEDVITILLALKKLRVRISGDEAVNLTIKVKGAKEVTAKDIDVPGQVEILNPELHIASLTEKSSELDVEIMVEKGLGYVSKEIIQKERVEIGAITLDAAFTPIRKANYEVENMRVGDRTDFNRLRVSLQTDGTISPKEAFESAINIMIKQLKAISGWKESEIEEGKEISQLKNAVPSEKEAPEKVKIEDLNLSPRISGVLKEAGIKTIGGLIKKKEENLLKIEGLGKKALEEIKKSLGNLRLSLKE